METQRARLVRKTQLSPDTTDFRFELETGRFTGLEPGAHALLNQQADFRVFYLVRSRDCAAMDAAFRGLELGDRYHLHCDDADGAFDLSTVIQSMPMGGEVDHRASVLSPEEQATNEFMCTCVSRARIKRLLLAP